MGTGGIKNNITFYRDAPAEKWHNVFVSHATSLCIRPQAIKMSFPGRRGQFSIRLRGVGGGDKSVSLLHASLN